MTQANPWHESDEFWETMESIMFDERRWMTAPAEVDQALALLGIEPGAAVLDLCCGVGRHSLELARRGYRVTGVDRTIIYLENARTQAAEEELEVEFAQDDMRGFCRPDSFDAAMMMYTSFGYFDDPAENRQVLLNLHRSLKDGGKLILDIVGKEVLARIFRARDWREQDGDILLEERRVTDDWNRIESQWTLLRGAIRHEATITHWIYSAAELGALLQGCGFRSADHYGSLDGASYDHTAERLVTVAHR